MEEYEKLELEVILLEKEDIIVCSECSGGPGIDMPIQCDEDNG